jgi:hypothetical protein
VAIQTERFEIREVVQAAQHFMRTAGLLDVVDLEPVGFPQTLIFGMRAGRRLMPAASAAVFVALLCRATSQRPPVVLPKCFGAAIAAPHLAPGREYLTAPAAGTVDACGKRAGSD